MIEKLQKKTDLTLIITLTNNKGNKNKRVKLNNYNKQKKLKLNYLQKHRQ